MGFNVFLVAFLVMLGDFLVFSGFLVGFKSGFGDVLTVSFRYFWRCFIAPVVGRPWRG